MPRSIGIWDLGFGIRDDGVKILVYISWVRIRYSISMNLFDIGNSTTRIVINEFVSKAVMAKFVVFIRAETW
jgi:hypothetical protein